MPRTSNRRRTKDRQACEYAEAVLTWVQEALDKGLESNGLFKGGALYSEVVGAKLCMRALNKRVEARASRGRYTAPHNLILAQQERHNG